MSLRISLDESESVEYFSNIISSYCDVLENLDQMSDSITKLINHQDMHGGIKSYLNATNNQIKKLKDYQNNVLISLYSYMSTYFTEIGETIYDAYTSSGNVNYPKAMAKYFYSPPSDSPLQTTQIANAMPDPSNILDKGYSLIEVEVDEQGTRQALKPYYADSDKRVQAANYNTNLDNRQESIIANGLLTTKSKDLAAIAKDFPGLNVQDIEDYNKSIGRIDENGNFHGDLVIPAYNSTDSKIRTAARTVEDGGTYNTPSFEVKEEKSSSKGSGSTTTTNKNTTPSANSTSNLSTADQTRIKELQVTIDYHNKQGIPVPQNVLDEYNGLNHKLHGGD